MNIRRWFLLGGIVAVNTSTLYVLFRLSTVFYSLQEYVSISSAVVITLFFLAETFIILNAIGYFVDILSATFFYTRPFLAPKALKNPPSVVVYIPVRTEPLDLLQKTFIACRYLDYPRLKIVIVDSSVESAHARAVQRLAKNEGLYYFNNPEPRHGAKAGALNEAIKRFPSKYYIVFDADYRPSCDFVKHLVPLMEADPKIAFIQTPQFYGNLIDSPVSRISQIQQSIFYEFISEGKSTHGGMFMCGTNLIIRCKALASVGGWDETSVTEDFSTSIALVKNGWKSLYYNYVMASGDGPVNLSTYFKQQYRWARGTFGAFFKNFWFLLKPWSPIAFSQRMEYALSGVYFFVGIVWIVLILMPVMYIFFRIPAYSSDPLLFSFAYFPYMVSSFSYFALSLAHRRFRITDLLLAQSLTLITLPIYIQALIDSALNRKATFETTDKFGAPLDIPWKQLRIQLAITFANAVAVPYGLWTLPHASNLNALISNIIWATFHTIILLYFIGTLYVAQQKNRT